MNEWIDELSDLTAANEDVVMVTIASIRGSAPREVGARMIVTTSEGIGTIGGGQLEHQCTRLAVAMLGGDEKASVRTFPLGAAMSDQSAAGGAKQPFFAFGSGVSTHRGFYPGCFIALRIEQQQPRICCTIGHGGVSVQDYGIVPQPGRSFSVRNF